MAVLTEWDEFISYRETLRTRDGRSTSQSTEEALIEYMPRITASASSTGDPEEPSLSSGALPVLAVAPDGLSGKEAGRIDIILWVGRNVDNPGPDVGSCPDPTAWTLLRLCRENQSFLFSFMQNVWTKLIPKSVIEDDGIEDFEGGRHQRRIEKLDKN